MLSSDPQPLADPPTLGPSYAYGATSGTQVELEAILPLLLQFSKADVLLWSKVVLSSGQ